MKLFFLLLVVLLVVCSDAVELAGKATHQSTVLPLISSIPEQQIRHCMEHLTQYSTRYYNSDGGEAASDYFFHEFSEIVEHHRHHNSNSYSGISVERYYHPNMPRQASIIGRIVGTVEKQERIIIGGHMDSCSFKNASGISEYPGNCWGKTPSQCPNLPNFAKRNAPGADDNASGSCAVLEIFRTLVKNGFIPERTVEVIVFAGEEWGILRTGTMQGLAGSTDIAMDYKANNVNVIAVLNFDSISRTIETQLSLKVQNLLNAPLNSLGVIVSEKNGWTNAVARSLQESCILAYTGCTVARGPEGLGKSDFASFGGQGYAAAGSVDSGIVLSDYLAHSDLDTMTGVNVTYVKEMVKMGVGFAVEGSYLVDTSVVTFEGGSSGEKINVGKLEGVNKAQGSSGGIGNNGENNGVSSNNNSNDDNGDTTTSNNNSQATDSTNSNVINPTISNNNNNNNNSNDKSNKKKNNNDGPLSGSNSSNNDDITNNNKNNKNNKTLVIILGVTFGTLTTLGIGAFFVVKFMQYRHQQQLQLLSINQ